MITARIQDNQVVFRDERTGTTPTENGWWDTHPKLALYIAANCDENCAVASVGDRVWPGTEEECAKAEQQLEMYHLPLVYDMGYYGLIHCEALEGEKFMPHEIVNRMY